MALEDAAVRGEEILTEGGCGGRLAGRAARGEAPLPAITGFRGSSGAESSWDSSLLHPLVLRSEDAHGLLEAATNAPGFAGAAAPFPGIAVPAFPQTASVLFSPRAGAATCLLTGSTAPLRRCVATITEGGLFKRVGVNEAELPGTHSGRVLYREFRLTPLGLFQLKSPLRARLAAEAAAAAAAGSRGGCVAARRAAAAAAGCAKPRVLFSSGLRVTAALLPAHPGEWRVVKLDGAATIPLAYFCAASAREAAHWVGAFNAAAGGAWEGGVAGEEGVALAVAAVAAEATPATSLPLVDALVAATLCEAKARSSDLSYSPASAYAPPAVLTRAASGFARQAALASAARLLGIGWAHAEEGLGASPCGATVALPLSAGGSEWSALAAAVASSCSDSVPALAPLLSALRLQNGVLAMAFEGAAATARKRRAHSGAESPPLGLSTAWVAADTPGDLAALCMPAGLPAIFLARLAATPSEAVAAQALRLEAAGAPSLLRAKTCCAVLVAFRVLHENEGSAAVKQISSGDIGGELDGAAAGAAARGTAAALTFAPPFAAASLPPLPTGVCSPGPQPSKVSVSLSALLQSPRPLDARGRALGRGSSGAASGAGGGAGGGVGGAARAPLSGVDALRAALQCCGVRAAYAAYIVRLGKSEMSAERV